MRLKLWIGALPALLLAGCTAMEPEAPAPSPVEATVPLRVLSTALEGDVQTRATTALTSGSIGVFLGTDGGYTAKNNRKYNYGNPAWLADGGDANAIYLGSASGKVCAYYPHFADAQYDNSAAIPLTTQLYALAQDLSYAKNKDVDGTAAKKSVAFVMERAYSQLKFVFKRTNYPGTCQVTKVEISNLCTAGSVNITDGTYSAPVNSTSFAYTTAFTLLAAGATQEFSLLAVPCTLTGAGLTILLTVDGKPMTTKIPIGTLPKLLAGSIHQITLNVSGTGASITVSTTDWPTTPTDNGEYIPEP